MDTPTGYRSDQSARLDIAVGGMSCASCAARVERQLNRLDGVTAAVNCATGRASIAFDGSVVAPQDLVATIQKAGYTAALPSPAGDRVASDADDGERDPLRPRLIMSAPLALVVLLLSMIGPLQFDHWQWLALLLATPVVAYGAWPFHRAALTNLRHRTVTMDTLVSLGVLAAYTWSLYALILGTAGQDHMTMHMSMAMPMSMNGSSTTDRIYLETASVVTAFLLAGRFFEGRAKRRAGAAVQSLLALGAKDVAILDPDGSERCIPIDELQPGDRFVVRPGEKIATDGIVEEGRSAVDQSLLSGETIPVEKHPGDEVTGASLNAGGRLVIRATRVGADTALAQIARLVEAAQTGKAPIQRLADRIAAVFVPAVIALALITFSAWIATGATATQAFSAAVAVLIVACPCALGLATPTALLVGTGRGAQLGLLIKGPEILESTRTVDTILLDKTGTLTTGRMTVVAGEGAPGITAREVLRPAGAVEDASEHPIGRAIADAARRETGPVPAVEGFRSHDGLGVEGTVDGRHVIVGRWSLIAEKQIALPQAIATANDLFERQGQTTILVAWEGQVRAVLALADTVKPGAAAAVANFRALGLHPVLITGDNAATAHAVADQLGIADVIAEVLPAGKADATRRLQEQGRVVAMVGDGVNDAPALAQADLGLAIGTGTDIAIEASDLTLITGDVQAAADAIRLSRATLRTIKQNLAWAFGYNIAALPLAAAGVLNPTIAGIAMSLSSIFVVANALRLRRFQPIARVV